MCATGCQRPSQLFKTQDLETDLDPSCFWFTRVSLYPFWGPPQSLFDHLDCFLTFQCSECHSFIFLPQKRATHKEWPFPKADTWGATNKQSPFKINELNDGQRSCSGGCRGRGVGHDRRRKTGLLLSDNDVSLCPSSLPILLTPSHHPFHPVSSPSHHR